MSDQGKRVPSRVDGKASILNLNSSLVRSGMLAFLLACAAALLFLPPTSARAGIGDLAVTDYQYVGATRFGRIHFDYRYTITVTNSAAALQNVVATAASTSPNTIIIQGVVDIGNIAATSSVQSTQTFTFRQDRSRPFDPNSIVWTFTAAAANTPPVANAGPDQSLVFGTPVTLDGTASTDADSDPLTYAWTLPGVPAGSTAALDDPTFPMPQFVADVPGDYVAELVVNDGTVDSSPDVVVVSTSNTPPVADAGLDQTVPVGAAAVIFGGASFDANGDALSYAWSLLSAPAGSAAALTASSGIQTGITVDVAGVYVIELIVNDGYDDSAPDTVTITSSNTAPVADAGGPYPEVTAGDTVELDGSFSFDVDDDSLSYLWSILTSPIGSAASLTDALLERAQLITDLDGLYIVQLIVNDGTVDSSPDTATIIAGASNEAPTAVASASATTVEPGAAVQLDGSASSDPEGSDLTYLWSLSTPNGSAAALSSTTTATPSFSTDLEGTYVATLVVNDGELDSTPASVSVSASIANNPPQLAAIGNRVMFLGSTLNFRLFGIDPDVGDILTYNLPTSPANMSVAAATGDVSFTPNASQLGLSNVIARVADAAGSSDVQAFTVEVRQTPVTPPSNSPPTLAPIANATRIVGVSLSIQTNASDPDAGDTLTYTLPLAPAGMTINSSGLIEFTAAANQVGLHDVTVQVADAAGAVALQSFIVTVRPNNRAPQAADDLYDARIGQTTSISAPGVLVNDSDPDGDAISAALLSNVTRGVLDFRNDGSFDYTPGLPGQTGPVELQTKCGYDFATRNLQTNGTILVGDVDNDGQLEIVGRNDSRPADGIFVLNATNCNVEVAATPGLLALGGFSQGFAPHLGLLDINGDGDLEIIGLRGSIPNGGGADTRAHLLAINHDGSPAWGTTGASQDSALVTFNQASNTGPVFADIDGDGVAEIIQHWVIASTPNNAVQAGVSVYNAANGTIRWEYLGAREAPGGNNQNPLTVVDLDLDGTMEIISHNSVISHLGTLEFILPTENDTPTSDFSTHLYSAVGNFDDDEFPEIIGRDQRNHYLYDYLGNVVWQIARASTAGTELTVADFDGDQEPEYAFVAGSGNTTYVQVFDTNGSPLWSHAGTPEFQDRLGLFSLQTITAFDANRDGSIDILIRFRDQNAGSEREGLYIFDGADGSLLTRYRIPIYDSTRRPVTVADVDDDGEAEILLSWTSGLAGNMVVLEGTAANPLPAAPGLFNQQVFNQSYFEDDGSVITDPTPAWLQPGRNGYNLISKPDKVYSQLQCEVTGGTFNRYTNATIAVGDVDNDGAIEIVGAGNITSTLLNELWLLNADDCSAQIVPNVSAMLAAGGFTQGSHLGLLDIDGDSDLEIIGIRATIPGVGPDGDHLLAVHHDGSLVTEWTIGGVGVSETIALDNAIGNSTAGGFSQMGPTFADLDANGTIEIIMPWYTFGAGASTIRGGMTVFNSADGSIAWEFTGDLEFGDSDYKPPTIADIDLDGTMEIVYRAYVIDHNGELEFRLPVDTSAGFPTHLATAVANFDDDPFAEIIAIDQRNHYLFNHDGSLIFRNPVPNNAGSQITVADFDGDNDVEYAWYNGAGSTQTRGFFEIYDTDGSLIWSHRGRPEFGEELTRFKGVNATAFDANNDGAFDLVVHLNVYLPQFELDGVYIFDGRDGSVLEFMPIRSNSSEQRFTTIADIDNDGAAEIISSQTSGLNFATRIWEGTSSHPLPSAPAHRNQWIFNEAYADARGNTLSNPVPHWLQPGSNGYNMIRRMPDPLAGTTDSFTYLANDGALNSNTATVTFDVQPAGLPPVFLSQPDTLTTVGFPYEYAPRVVDGDPGDSISFMLAAAPAGMTMATNGQLNWLPDVEGSFQVSIIASDTIGFSTPQSFTLLVGQPVVVPNVVGQAQATAETTLTVANLLTGNVRNSTHPTIAAGSVFEQTPIAGSVAEFGGRVDLRVSTGPAPEDTDDDGDGLSENMGDCNDGDASIGPGAADPAGDGIDQDCDGIDGNLVLTGILVSPTTSTVLTNQSVSLTATGIFEDGTSQNLSAVVNWTNGPSFSSASAGTFTATASRAGINGTATINVAGRVAGDTVPPVVAITAPADDSTVTEPVEVIGSASDANFLKYVLEYAPAGADNFTTIVTSATPVTNGVLGQFDPTLLLNDLYRIRVTVFDAGGNQTFAETTVQVDGKMKVGNFSVSFTDLDIPMSGIPILVQRTYDSRDKGKGDFGFAWQLSVKTLRVTKNRTLGTGWRVVKNGLAFQLLPEGTHTASLTLPSGKVERFDLVISPAVSPIVPFPVSALRASYRPRAGTEGSLESLNNNNLSVLDSQPGVATLRDDLTGNVYNPTRFRYTTVDGTELIISDANGLESIRERNGNTLTINNSGVNHSSGRSVLFVRDDLNRIVGVISPSGASQSYGYDSNGDLTAHTDPEGNVTRFRYARDHYLLEIEDPLGRVTSRSEYDSVGRLVASTGPEGRRISMSHDIAARRETITDVDGAESSLEYDDYGNVTRTVDALGFETTNTYDGSGNRLTSTNALGESMTFTYDSSGNQLTRTNAAGETLSAEYDVNGQIVRLIDSLGREQVRNYDARGNLLRLTDDAGLVIEALSYDGNGNLATISDALNRITRFEYDQFGNAVSEILPDGSEFQFGYDANGARISTTNPRGFETRFEVDYLGRPVLITDALGNQTVREYDPAGVATASVDALGNRTERETDASGNMLSFVDATGRRSVFNHDERGNATEFVHSTGARSTHVFDALDRPTSITLPDGSINSAVYDPLGRVSVQSDGAGRTIQSEFDAAGRTTSLLSGSGTGIEFNYDAAGNMVTRTDERGGETQVAYDIHDRPVRYTYASGGEQLLAYDLVGNLIANTDPAGRTTTYSYDSRGNMVSLVDPLGNETRYEFDENRNLVAAVNAIGQRTRYEYDALDRISRTVFPDGSIEDVDYDANGNVASVTDGAGLRTTYAYNGIGQIVSKQDAAGNLTTYTYGDLGLVEVVAGPEGAMTFVRDEVGRITSLTNADGSEIQYSYNGAGQILEIGARTAPGEALRTTSYEYDQDGRLVRIVDSNGGEYVHTYDASGNVTSVDYPNGARVASTYDSVGRATRRTISSLGVTVAQFDYELDAFGDIVRVTDLDGAFVEYGYDTGRKIGRESYFNSGGTLVDETRFVYDAVGNRVLQERSGNSPISYEYDAADKLLSAGDVTFSYDGAGRLVGELLGSEQTRYQYDAEGRMVNVSAPSSQVSYSYDALGRRVSRESGGMEENYLIDEQNPTGVSQVISEYSSGGVSTDHVFGLSLLRSGQDTVERYIHSDATKNVRLVSDGSGSVSDTYDYSAFGEIRTRTGSSGNPYQFATESFDDTTGQLDLRARMYDPEFGRFTSRDPFSGIASDPLSLNKYIYARQNPNFYTDPEGEFIVAGTVVSIGIAYAMYSAYQKYDIGHGGFIDPQNRRTKHFKLKTCPGVSVGLVLGINEFGAGIQEDKKKKGKAQSAYYNVWSGGYGATIGLSSATAARAFRSHRADSVREFRGNGRIGNGGAALLVDIASGTLNILADGTDIWSGGNIISDGISAYSKPGKWKDVVKGKANVGLTWYLSYWRPWGTHNVPGSEIDTDDIIWSNGAQRCPSVIDKINPF